MVTQIIQNCLIYSYVCFPRASQFPPTHTKFAKIASLGMKISHNGFKHSVRELPNSSFFVSSFKLSRNYSVCRLSVDTFEA